MVEFTSVKDSGEREDFETGARRDIQVGKGRYDLISPIFLRRLAQHFENGAVKYGIRNWEKVIPLTRYLDSAMRHLCNFIEGDRSEDHLSACAWNISCVIHTEEMIERGLLPESLNDLPSFIKEEVSVSGIVNINYETYKLPPTPSGLLSLKH